MTRAAIARDRLARHGEVRAQPATDWTGTVPLPAEIAAFYAEVGPVDVTIESVGNPFYFPSLARLWPHQAGYRWDAAGARVEGWADDWFVVATQGGDPILFDVASGGVLFAEHGQGAWEPGDLVADLPTLAACLGTLGGVVLDAGDAFFDDDFRVHPEARGRAVAGLSAVLGSAREAEALLDGFGWG